MNCCAAPGFCPRNNRDMPLHLWQLCKTDNAYHELFGRLAEPIPTKGITVFIPNGPAIGYYSFSDNACFSIPSIIEGIEFRIRFEKKDEDFFSVIEWCIQNEWIWYEKPMEKLRAEFISVK
ncbi:MAG: hypothetical protein K2X29_05465 [Candidatus Obscuribacterales bacterium]|nr:hypothetical protein [Candidatus Obscuribacterales bacterium]